MSKKLVSFNPSDTYAIAQNMMKASGVDFDHKAINQIIFYLVENMDKNLAYTSTFWDIRAFKHYVNNTNNLLHCRTLNEKQEALLSNMLQNLGLSLYGTIYNNNIFRSGQRDTFPYIVVDVNNAMIILEEDIN